MGKPTLPLGRFFTAFALAIMLYGISLAPQINPAYALITHECSISGHCYGINSWLNNPYDGTRTNILVRGMGDSDSASGSFVDNEMWLIDPNCGGSGQNCWIEGGYIKLGPIKGPYFPSNIEDWFWGEGYSPGAFYGCSDPNPLNNDPGGNSDYGHNVYINLYRTSEAGNWGVVIQGNRTSWSVNGSGCNYIGFLMSPSRVDIGQEVYAASSANVNAPHADFTGNMYETPNFGPYYYQTVDGMLDRYIDSSHMNPPWVGWNSGQDPMHNSTGGSFYTCTLPSNGPNPC